MTSNSTHDSHTFKVLIGATGSVASIKIPKLVDELITIFNGNIEIKVVATQPALHFFKREEVKAPVLTDEDEWSAWKKMSDPVMHIELRNWADLIVVAPLDANTLAKVSHGIRAFYVHGM
ncbi:hypothetical protein HDU76_013506 [Blyttiomyces sp. JEL0837]|nr:hypothetical protein HDU76_013506 [Blyttiomyces sp. JEL0837]